MKPFRKLHLSFPSSTIVYSSHNDQTSSSSHGNTCPIPIDNQISITVRLPTSRHSSAAVKIQSAYRSYVIRHLVKKISSVNSETNRLQRLLQQQDTVDAIRTDNREKIRMNEALMSLLLRLDAVPGIDLAVRELRRSVSRRIVGLQEILDSVSDPRVAYDWDGFLRNWDEDVALIEQTVCREKGGNELEKFCAENLGFRCLQRFLRGS